MIIQRPLGNSRAVAVVVKEVLVVVVILVIRVEAPFLEPVLS